MQLTDMTTEEIVAQGITFFVAGYDTTSICLQFLAYLLAMNPDKQEQLHDEIVAVVGDVSPLCVCVWGGGGRGGGC